MILLADESVDRPIVERLRQDGHDVTYVAELSPSISDEQVLQEANTRNALLLTEDKDFGELVYLARSSSCRDRANPLGRFGGGCESRHRREAVARPRRRIARRVFRYLTGCRAHQEISRSIGHDAAVMETAGQRAKGGPFWELKR
jgi:Domain of unknown function (DUF5615)